MNIFKPLVLILIVLATGYLWPQLLILTGGDPTLLICGCAVGFCLLVMWAFLPPRTTSKVDLKAELAAMEQRLLAAQTAQLDSLVATLEDKGHIGILEQLQLLQGFNPSVGEKVPQLLEFVGKLKQMRWPQLDTGGLKSLLQTVDVLNKLGDLDQLAGLKAKLDVLDVAGFAETLANLDTVITKLEYLSIDGDNENRDFDDLGGLADEAGTLWDDYLKPLAERFDADAEVMVKRAAEVLESTETVISNIENLQCNDNGDNRDFDDLETLGTNAVNAVQKVGTAVNAVSFDATDMAQKFATIGKIISEAENAVLDDDGDAKDFDNLNEGLDNLNSFVDKVVPMVQKFQQRSA